MQTHPVRAQRDIRHDDPRLRYRGAVSLQRGPGWTAPWRLPREEAALHLPGGGLGRVAMPSGVRVTLRTDSASLVCRYQAECADIDDRGGVAATTAIREPPLLLQRPAPPASPASPASPARRREVTEQSQRGLDRHRLMKVLADRSEVGSPPGARADGYRVVLAIEGGGMRGTVSAGMAPAVHEPGLLNAFDAVYGASAGAISAATG